MSSVFVARDNGLGRTVVVKVLPLELAATVSVDRFKREIMLSAALQHPHIVPVLSAGEVVPEVSGGAASASRLPFFIMPFVEGESLRARLARGPLSIREAVSVLKDVARALVYAHGRGVIHRDIKPDNILLTSGSATVTDFGVAKAISAARELPAQPSQSARTGAITLVGTSIGTPAYMAPEQAAGDPATDHRADLYALGIVGYEMLVGTPPFHGRAPQQLLAAQLTEAPAAIGTRRYDVPDALAALLMRMLEKDPARRPKSASDVARALEDPAVVSGTFTSALVPRGARPKRVLWALAGAGMLASVAAGGAWLSNRRPLAAPAPATAVAPLQSIAVMPLVNISRDTNDAYFSAGMTADLTNALARIPGLRVASSQNTERDQSGDPTAIGKALGVNMVLVGTVQRDRTRLRVTARLVNTADGLTVWSDMYERDSKDVFKVQDEISSAIVAAISPTLAAGRAPAATIAAATTAHGTNNLQAYDLYLRGRYFFDKRGERGLRSALDYFQQAAREDSGFARAYAGMANVYALLPLYANVAADSVRPLALAAINHAIGLDSGLAEAFSSRATILQAGWRWDDAERDYRRALRLDPNDATAHQWLGELLLLRGRTADARQQLDRARQLDPLSPVIAGSYALAVAAGRAYPDAIAAGQRAVGLDSTSLVARFMLGSVLLQAGQATNAVAQLEAASGIDSTSIQTVGLLGYAYAKVGNTARAMELATGLEARAGLVSGAAAAAARVYLGLGDTSHALDLLAGAAARHDSFFSSESLSGSYFDPVRGDPRFAALVRTVRLDPAALTR
jgi:serine/threonine-protein kinase